MEAIELVANIKSHTHRCTLAALFQLKHVNDLSRFDYIFYSMENNTCIPKILFKSELKDDSPSVLFYYTYKDQQYRNDDRNYQHDIENYFRSRNLIINPDLTSPQPIGNQYELRKCTKDKTCYNQLKNDLYCKPMGLAPLDILSANLSREIFHNGAFVGYIGIEATRKELIDRGAMRFDILDFYILKDMQKKGIGSKVLEYFIPYKAKVSLSTCSNNYEAILFYKNSGFKCTPKKNSCFFTRQF